MPTLYPPPQLWLPSRPAIVRAQSLNEIKKWKTPVFLGSGAVAAALFMDRGPFTIPHSLGSVATVPTGGTSYTLTTTEAIPSGSTPFVAAGGFVGGAGANITGVSDGTNTYSRATADASATTGWGMELWYKLTAAVVATGATITVTFGNTPGGSIDVLVVAGYVLGPASIDKTNHGPINTGTAYASGSTGLLAVQTEVAIGVAMGYASAGTTAATFTEGTGFTRILTNNGGGGASFPVTSDLAYQLTQATTALNYQPVSNINMSGASLIATFQ